MKELALALIAGVMVGFIFKAIHLPLPAPPVLAGILGILGIYLGGIGYDWVVLHFFGK